MWAWIALAVIAVLVVAREFAAIWLPWYVAINSVETGRKEMAAKLYERVISRRALFSHSIQNDARYRLSWLRMDAGRYDEAVELLRACLKTKHRPAIEANHRQRLAEALEGAGKIAEAESERRRVLELLSDSDGSVDGLLVQAKTLNRQQQFAQAYVVLERALAKIPAANTEARGQVMIQLGLAAFNSGKAPETVHWAQQALAVPGGGHSLQTTGHSVCALGLLNLGKLDEAEAHRRQALALAQGVESADQSARYLVQLADIVRRRGRLNEALRMCDEARGMTVSERRHVYAVEQSCLQDKGQFKEAHELFAAMRRAKQYPTPSEQRRMEAAQDGFEAQLLLELGRPEDALANNTSALERLAGDQKLSFQFQADRAWILAALGRRDEALAQASEVEARMPEAAVSRGSQVTGLYSLGRAYLAMEDWERARGAWQRYQDLQPDPVDEPKGHYYLAQALVGLHRTEESLVALQSAASGPQEQYLTRAAALRVVGKDPGTRR